MPFGPALSHPCTRLFTPGVNTVHSIRARTGPSHWVEGRVSRVSRSALPLVSTHYSLHGEQGTRTPGTGLVCRISVLCGCICA